MQLFFSLLTCDIIGGEWGPIFKDIPKLSFTIRTSIKLVKWSSKLQWAAVTCEYRIYTYYAFFCIELKGWFAWPFHQLARVRNILTRVEDVTCDDVYTADASANLLVRASLSVHFEHKYGLSPVSVFQQADYYTMEEFVV